MSTKSTKLPLIEKIGYGLGDTASNLYFQSAMLFIPFFYTDIVGLAPAAMAWMIVVTKLLNAFADPLIGSIADRTETRWGKFRPYLLWMAIPYGLSGILLFYKPDFGPTGAILYAGFTYFFMLTAYSAINVPYSALMGVMSSDSKERDTLSSFRFVGAFLGLFIIIYAGTDFAKSLGATGEIDADGQPVVDLAKGYLLAMSIIAVLATVLFFITFVTTRERTKPVVEDKKDKSQDYKDLLKNIPWLILFAFGILNLTNIAIRNAAAMYYFENYVGDEAANTIINVLGMSINAGSMGTFMLCTIAMLIVGSACTTLWLKFIDKKWLMLIVSMANAVLMISFYLPGPNDLGTMYALNLSIAFISGPVSPLIFSMYADTSDYSEWKTGRRAMGLVYAAASFSMKAGLIIGSALVGWILGGFGYITGTEQTPTAIEGIRLMMSAIPGAFALAAACLVSFYPLNNKKLREIATALQSQNTNNES